MANIRKSDFNNIVALNRGGVFFFQLNKKIQIQIKAEDLQI
jgi:hypothetical protein